MDELQGYYLSVIQKNVHLRFYLSSDMCEIISFVNIFNNLDLISHISLER